MTTIEGTAYNAKQGALVETPSGAIWVDLEEWPDDVVGTKIKVTGRYETWSDQPVFVDQPDEPIVSGVPVPPGTDLGEASKRDVLIMDSWEPVPPEQR